MTGGFHQIAAGSTTSSIPIVITGDATYEADETFTVVIGGATTTPTSTVTVVQAASTTVVTILNDDSLVAVADPNYAATEDTQLVVGAPGVQGNDTIFGIVSWTSTVETNVATGTLALAADGSFTYDPPQNFPYTSTTGTVTFLYRIADGRFTSTATSTVTVTNSNDAPVTQDILFPVLPDATTTVAAPGVLSKAYDVDGNALTASVVGSVSTGTLKFQR